MGVVALSRAEAILRSKIDGTAYTAIPLSRIEEELIELDVGGGGGGGGTIDTELSPTSTHAVQNQAITKAIEKRVAKVDNITTEEQAAMWEDHP